MQIQNENASSIIREEAKLTLAEGWPQVLLPNVVPVMDMTPSFHQLTTIIKDSTSSANSNPTVYTVPTKKVFYLTACKLSYQKDAACDATTGQQTITATIDGSTIVICGLASITLTAEKDSIFQNFQRPIKLKAGSVITSGRSGSFTVGALQRSATVFGYELDEM